MGLKHDLLRQAEDEFAGLKTAVAGLGEAELTRVWSGTWSVRDILGHIVGWHREMIPAFERMARGERPFAEGVSFEDVDAWNENFAAAWRGHPAAAALRALEASHRDFLTAAQQVPDERFAPDKTATRLLDMNGPHHYREHAAEIRAWRARERL
jgi:hypothetical protein